MEAPNSDTLPPPPGVVVSIRAGFDAIASHIAAILLPLILDLWLWLGPRLSMERLFQPVLLDIRQMAKVSGLTEADIDKALEMYRTIFHEFNLFSILRTFPIGVTSLMMGRMPLKTPLGIPAIIQVNTAESLLMIMFGLTLVGWLAGGLYFRWVSAIVATGQDNSGAAIHSIIQALLFSVIWAIVSFALGMPVLFIVYLLFAISPSLAQGIVLFLGFLSMWLVVPLFFSPHGIFVRKQNAFASIVGSLRMARFTLPSSSMFVLSIFLLGVGLNFLWSVPPEDSWMALVGIFGHAFVTTALLAASFIYYRDMTSWLQTVLDRFKTNAVTTRRA
jgi:hypothetical protein